jgi:hypothetical protein
VRKLLSRITTTHEARPELSHLKSRADDTTG